MPDFPLIGNLEQCEDGSTVLTVVLPPHYLDYLLANPTKELSISSYEIRDLALQIIAESEEINAPN